MILNSHQRDFKQPKITDIYKVFQIFSRMTKFLWCSGRGQWFFWISSQTKQTRCLSSPRSIWSKLSDLPPHLFLSSEGYISSISVPFLGKINYQDHQVSPCCLGCANCDLPGVRPINNVVLCRSYQLSSNYYNIGRIGHKPIILYECKRYHSICNGLPIHLQERISTSWAWAENL